MIAASSIESYFGGQRRPTHRGVFPQQSIDTIMQIIGYLDLLGCGFGLLLGLGYQSFRILASTASR